MVVYLVVKNVFPMHILFAKIELTEKFETSLPQSYIKTEWWFWAVKKTSCQAQKFSTKKLTWYNWPSYHPSNLCLTGGLCTLHIAAPSGQKPRKEFNFVRMLIVFLLMHLKDFYIWFVKIDSLKSSLLYTKQ